MGFIDLSVKRAVAIFCLMIGLGGLGLNSYRKLALEELPKTDMPYVTIITVYPGASPNELETDVAKPIEDAVAGIDGLKSLRSTCMENACVTFLEFNVGVDVDIAANDTRDHIDEVINNFPEGVEKPRVLKYDINAQPVINLAITGDLVLEELFDYADNDLRDRLSAVRGVADISLIGGSRREVQVLLDRKKLAARGLSSMNVVETLGKEIKMIPAGRIRQEGIEYSIKFDAELKEISSIENIEVANQNGMRCYIRDVGSVIMGTEEMRQGASIDGRQCVAVKIIKKADANAVEVVKRVKEEVKKLQNNLPGGLEIVWVADAGNYVQASVDSAASNIWQGILLTAIIMFLFLYHAKSTLIIAISMPVTVIAGIFMIFLFGYSLNTATLLALGLSVGILVTNSIVVLESIVSELDNAKDTQEAAIKGTKNVFAAIFASAATNIVVLFPIGMMKGLIGQFFIPFAMTMVGITAISLFVSFTLTPALSGRILKKGEEKSTLSSKMEQYWNYGFNKIANFSTKIVRGLINNRLLSIICVIIVALLFVHAVYLIPKIGFSFLPITDRAEATVKIEFPTSFSLENTMNRLHEIEKTLADVPHLKHRLSTAGKIDGTVGQTSEGVYLAQIVCYFTDKTERKTTIHELSDIITEKLKDVSDAMITISLPDQTGAGAEIKMIICGDDFDELDEIVQKLVMHTSAGGWLKDIETSSRPGKNELIITPKRAILGDLKVPAAYLGASLRTNIEGTKAASYKSGERTYDIRVKMQEKQGIKQIEEIQIPALPGYPVMLSNFVDIKQQQTPILISRHNKRRSIMFYANPTIDTPLGAAASRLQNIVTENHLLPAGYTSEFSGKIEVMEEGIEDFIEVGIVAFILTYLVLASVLNSFTQPLIILITIPLGLIGCVWALALTGEPISMMVLLGGVMLIGIVVNNAILIMERVALNIKEGMKSSEAMILAFKQEFRAVTMITLAAVFGMLPMAFDTSIGSELRTGIGMAAVGGIAISAFFTMLMLPVFYCLFNPD